MIESRRVPEASVLGEKSKKSQLITPIKLYCFKFECKQYGKANGIGLSDDETLH